jgi:hypothetical protein
MLATFDVAGQRFKAWVTNKTAIDQVLAIQTRPYGGNQSSRADSARIGPGFA